ncbi:Tho complex subunit 7-domain-containing protein [Dunaliella salina]|uniref:Tho complex subunit 7-domain-containing protein n=1 Tax=Dunaliella salina TaxID=3046 RepID=A0ABQ7H3Q3_DUNSA|nr:Tho complex subunit 7-domain-containing protein [Dunaliella salina]|eukprot:KAF5841487.1 Tho complex subunit 7-domain-containing protein [Dunaliella salina]
MCTYTGAEEDQIIRARFLTQTSVTRGEPPFRKLTKKFIHLCEQAERGTPQETHEAHEQFVREAAMIQLQFERMQAVADANRREQQNYIQKQQQLQAEIEQVKQDIQTKKMELEQARQVRQHNEEYEVLRHLLAQHPPRAATQAEIDRINGNIKRITAQGNKVAATMQKRRQQFALLFHVIEELQRCTEESEEHLGEEVQQMEVDS